MCDLWCRLFKDYLAATHQVASQPQFLRKPEFLESSLCLIAIEISIKVWVRDWIFSGWNCPWNIVCFGASTTKPNFLTRSLSLCCSHGKNSRTCSFKLYWWQKSSSRHVWNSSWYGCQSSIKRFHSALVYQQSQRLNQKVDQCSKHFLRTPPHAQLLCMRMKHC